MRKLVYDVATTLDNFISHHDGNVDGFVSEGDHVVEYLERLEGYDTVVMGRNTYEWGYRMGLPPGAAPYPHMKNYVFSRTLRLENSPVTIVERDELAVIERLKAEDGADIYLCGGGAFAGMLLDHGLIDQLVIKLNPIVYGNGIRLFGNSTRQVDLRLVSSKAYDTGVILLRYDLLYAGAGRKTLAEIAGRS
jgi:dihydrofolate reductase